MSQLPAWLDRQFLQWQLAQGSRRILIEFAAYLEISRTSLNKWMNGGRTLNHLSIEKIADKLGPEIYDLMGLARPNPRLRRIEQAFQYPDAEQQESYASQIERLAAQQQPVK